MLEAILVLNILSLIVVVWLAIGIKSLFGVVAGEHQVAASEQRILDRLRKIDDRISVVEDRLWLQNDDEDEES